MPDRLLASDLSAALERLASHLGSHSSFLSSAVHSWMCRISPAGEPAIELVHPQMFPILQLPDWLVESFSLDRNHDFHQAVTYSSLCGYYYTRLIDNIMDAHTSVPEETHLLPAAGFFSVEFHSAYQKFFPAQHAFWRHFQRIWIAAVDSTAHDATLPAVSRDEFEHISSRKFAAVEIPVVATAYFYERPEAIDGWIQFVRVLGKWSQVFDDLMDWHADRSRGQATWFLSEAKLRKRSSESIDQWVAREGLAWGLGILDQWMDDLRSQAGALASFKAQEFLQQRASLREERAQILEKGFASLTQLASILGKT